MDSLDVPDLNTLRHWLDDMGISFFECDSCQALHLPHMQNFEGIFDAKIDLLDNVVLFSALAEVKPSALLPLAADLSAINASSLTVKASASSASSSNGSSARAKSRCQWLSSKPAPTSCSLKAKTKSR